MVLLKPLLAGAFQSQVQVTVKMNPVFRSIVPVPAEPHPEPPCLTDAAVRVAKIDVVLM